MCRITGASQRRILLTTNNFFLHTYSARDIYRGSVRAARAPYRHRRGLNRAFAIVYVRARALANKLVLI